MREIAILFKDDLDMETPVTRDSGRGILLGLDARIVELDLSEDNEDALRDFLAPYLEAGKPTAAMSSRRGHSRGGASAERRIYNAGMRAYAERVGIPVPHLEAGGYKYSKVLMQEFEEKLAAGEINLDGSPRDS